jgi:hypothetical protein
MLRLIPMMVILFSSLIFAEQILYGEANISQPEFTIIESKDESIVFDVRFPESVVVDSLVEGKLYDRILMSGMGHLIKVGFPQLPQTTRFLAIDTEGGFEVSVSDIQFQEYQGFEVYPAQPPLKRDESAPEFQIDESFYESNSWYPTQPAVAESPAIWREIRVLPVNICPFQYNPVKKQLKVITAMRIRIHKTSRYGENVISRPDQTISRSFHSLYREFILNYDDYRRESVAVLDGLPNMLIITHDHFSPEVLPFAHWKNEKGVETAIFRTSEIGVNPTASHIKTFIENYYQAATDKPDYLLIVGDVTGPYAVPWFSVSGSMTDHPYYQLVGTDILPDISGARISVQTLTEANNVFSKLIAYEKTPYLLNQDWFHSSLIINSDDFQDPQAGFWAKGQFSAYGYSPIYHLGDNLGNATIANVNSAVNSGISYIYYIGHGAPSSWSTTGFSTSNIRNLTNGAMQPVISSVACNNADLDVSTDVFAEVWLKYSNLNGSVGIMAFTESCSVYDTDTLARGMVRALLSDSIPSFGNIIDYGRMYMYQYWTSACSPAMHQSLLVGEPELQVWTRTPEALLTTIPTVAFFNAPIPVQISTSQGPLEGALVCYSDSLGNYERGYTDQNGSITLNPGISVPAAGRITVTAHNCMPVQSDITILPPNGPYVMVNDLIVLDTLGNNNQVVEAGEHFFFQLQLENIGSDPADSLWVTISSADSQITFLNDSSSFGSLAPSASVISGSFAAQVNSSIPHRYVIPLDIEVAASGGNIWQQSYWLEVRQGASIAVSSDSLLFPATFQSFSSELQLTCDNIGPDTLWIHDIISDIPQFSTNVSRLEIPPGFSEMVILQFIPDSVMTYNGTITIINSDPVKFHINVHLEGTGINAPDIEIEDSLQVYANTSDSLTRFLTVSNVGLGDLYFSAQIAGYRPGQNNIEGSGGADAFGHIWVDSDESSGPRFDWIDISGTGTLIQITGNNSVSDPIPIGFDFSFYGSLHQTYRVCSNGWISFSTISVAYNNLALPNNLAPRNLIAPLWDDLLLTPGSEVYYENMGNKHVVMFRNLTRVTGEGPYNFEVILYDNGNIILQYLVLNNIMEDYTVGIQNGDATDGLTIAHNEYYLKDSLAILISKHSWLTVEPTSGRITANNSMDLQLTVLTENFPMGDFYAAVQIESNDPDEPLFIIPVHLYVGVTGIENINDGQIPATVDLAQNYPNPFNPSTTIKYDLPSETQVELAIYNLLGQKVRTLISGEKAAGFHAVHWDGKNEQGNIVASGIYIYSLKTENKSLVRKMIFMK